MSDYINESADIFNEPPKKKGFTVKKLLKAAALLIIIFVYGVLFARCVMSSDSSRVKKVIEDDELLAAYNENPEEFYVEQYGMPSAWVAIREGRLVEFNYLYYIPSVNKLQVSVKFNTDLAGFDYKEEIPFKFRLYDDGGNEYTDYIYEYDEKFGYGYIRLGFNGIELVKSGEYGEDGKELRKTYKLYIDMVNPDGGYDELCEYDLYNGSDISKKIGYKP